jgi:phosphate transport system permease protein
MSTEVIVPAVQRTPPRKVRTSPVTPDMVSGLIASALGSLGLVWLLYERLLPLSGTLGFWLCWYVGFLGLYALVVISTQDRLAVADRLAAVLFSTAGLVLFGVLALVVGFVVDRGWGAVRHLNFFTQTTAFIGPDDPLTRGGIYAAAVGTLEQVAISTLICVPLGIATALYLNEVRGRLAAVVRTIVEAMTAIPSILAGLFIFAAVVLTLGFNRSGLAASLALAVEMLPIVTRTAELVLRLVPNGLREASAALGASQWETVRRVVLPTARPSLVTAVLLGVARVVGETSPILLTAGFTNELNYDPLHGPQVSLPLFAFTEVRFPLDNAIARAFGAAVVLLLLVLVLFTAARVIGGRPAGRTSRRERRRLTAMFHNSPDPTARRQVTAP